MLAVFLIKAGQFQRGLHMIKPGVRLHDVKTGCLTMHSNAGSAALDIVIGRRNQADQDFCSVPGCAEWGTNKACLLFWPYNWQRAPRKQ